MPVKTKLDTEIEIKEYFGEKKYKLSPIREVERLGNKRTFLFLCDCGKEHIAHVRAVKSGHTKSCGCQRVESTIKRSTKHGKAKLPEYQIWAGIKTRTTNKKRHGSEKDYVFRGIKMSNEWINNFDKFYEDMGPRPSTRHTIERIDNSKGYFRTNCKWATRTEQNRNKRNNLLLDYQGKTKCISEWSEITGINEETLRSRFHKWGNCERVLTTPVKKNKR